MSSISRRSFLGTTASASVAALSGNVTLAGRQNAAAQKVPVIHVTDLFRPHMDPDDHWDLACVYALAYLGQINLEAIVIDFPVKDRDPDVIAVAQMNHITGLAVPSVVGSSRPFASRRSIEPRTEQVGDNAAQLVLDILDASPTPVIINTTGRCRDIAIAATRNRELFSKKCARVYLNAGTGSPDPAQAARLEYNVRLDPVAYATIFDLPCPVYWMPCFEQMQSPWAVRQYGTFYRFRQSEILPHLSDRMQNFFAYMLGKIETQNWLRYLTGPKDQSLLAEHSMQHRNMWCTAGFFHAAGKTVLQDGKIVPLSQAENNAVFTFEPISVSCNEDAVTRWTKDPNAKNRFVFNGLSQGKGVEGLLWLDEQHLGPLDPSRSQVHPKPPITILLVEANR